MNNHKIHTQVQSITIQWYKTELHKILEDTKERKIVINIHWLTFQELRVPHKH